MGSEQRDQSLPFMFEIVHPNSGDTLSFVLPVNPQDYSIASSPMSQIKQTHGGLHVERSGLAPQKISMQGTFGYRGTLKGGNAKRLSAGADMTGWDLYKQIEEGLTSFYRSYESTVDSQGTIKFYNFADQAFFEVEVTQFTFLRSTKHPHLYRYNIAMTVLGPLDVSSSGKDDLLSQTLSEIPEIAEETGFWSSLVGTFSSTSQLIIDKVAKIEAIEEQINTVALAVSNFRSLVSDFIEAPFSLIGTTIDAIDSVIDTIESIEELPHEVTSHLNSVKRQFLVLTLHEDKFQESLATTGSNASELYASDENYESDDQEIVTVEIEATAKAVGARSMDIPELTLFANDDTEGESYSSVSQKVTHNMTIRGMAEKYLGSSDSWQRIAAVNNLEYPYIVAEDSFDAFRGQLYRGRLARAVSAESVVVRMNGYTPEAGDLFVVKIKNRLTAFTISSCDSTSSSIQKITLETEIPVDLAAETPVYIYEEELSVLRPGDSVLIPNGTDSTLAIVPNSDAGEFEVKAYGIDEYTDADGQHLVSGTGAEVTVSGDDNLVMQLQHRLSTMRGELAELGHSDYGSDIPKMIGKALLPVWQERIKLEAKRAILEDPRISSVGDLTITIDGSLILISGDVSPINKGSAQQISVALT